MTSADDAPVLSVCIPTHHGRAAVLDRLLTRLAEGLVGLPVEICVSDNAAHDETAEVISRHRDRLGDRLVASRNERDLGLTANLLRVAALARGRYLWFIGSDDLPVRDAVAEVLALVALRPDLAGACVGLRRVDHRDLVGAAPALFAEAVPAERRATVYTSRPEVLAAVGLLPWALSANVIRRDAWVAAVRAEGDAISRFPNFPQLLVIGRAMRDEPCWAWHPRQLVLSSSGTYYLDDDDQLPGDPIGQISKLTSELDGVFARLYGRFSRPHRALMHRWRRIVLGETAVQGARAGGAMSLRDDVRQLVSGCRSFWFLREFRRQALPVLLVPSAVASRWSSRSVVAGPGLAPRHLPERWTTGYQHQVTCSVSNSGSRTLPWIGARAVRLGSRWYDEDGVVVGEGPRAAIVPGLRPGRRCEVQLRVDAPHQPGTYRLGLASVQENVRWFDEEPAHIWTGTVVVSEPPSLVPG